MKVCLIRPPSVSDATYWGTEATPPISLAYLAASILSRTNFSVTAIDGIVEAIRQYSLVDDDENKLVIHGLTHAQVINKIPKDVDVIGITIMFSMEWSYNKKLIQNIRKVFPHTKIVVGGEHITALTEYTLRDCPSIDFAVLGEGEETIVELLNKTELNQNIHEIDGLAFLKENQFLKNPPRKRIQQIDDIPEPNWDILPIEEYIENAFTHGANLGRTMPLIASRGCPFRCTFCSNEEMWTTKWLARKPQNVVNEIKKYIKKYNVSNFDFYDLTAIVQKKWIVEFCTILINENLNITWSLPTGTRSEAIDNEVAKLLFKSGCRQMNYAPESGSPEELKRIKKMVNLDQMLSSMKSAKKTGLKIKSNIIFGLPGSTLNDVLLTYKFIIRMAIIGIHDISCFPYSPYPGTELFNNLVESKKITVNDDYFKKMLLHSNPEDAYSYNSFSKRQISLQNIIGMLIFYSINFSLRPHRFINLVWDLALNDNSEKMTMAISNKKRKTAALKMLQQSDSSIVTIDKLYKPKMR